MKRHIQRLMTLCAVSGSFLVASANVIINEVMQSNIDGIYDEISREFPDSWIELYNNSNKNVSISGWYIGLKNDISNCYKLPNLTIPANGYQLIYCDKTGNGINADFRVDSGKCEIYLFDSKGKGQDHVAVAKMEQPQVSRMLCSDGKWRYAVNATPGAANTSPYAEEILPSPVFSAKGGVFKDAFELTISMPQGESLANGTRLAVTTDGREPQKSDIVDAAELKLQINESKVVRAKLFSDSKPSPRAVTHSYIFHPRETNMTIVSIVADPDYFYSKELGIFNGDNKEDPNYEYDYRRPINIEVFDGDNNFKTTNNLLGETRVMGGYTRIKPQKSLAVYANKRFGTKRFDSSNFWPGKPHVQKVKSLCLRNGGQDFDRAHIRDAWAHTLAGKSGWFVEWQGYRPVVYYINGEYKGIYDLRERSNEDYIEANYDGLEAIDMMEDWNEIKAGSLTSVWLDILSKICASDMTYEKMTKLIDEESFLTNFVMRFFGADTDFMGHNVIIWRHENSDDTWKWFVKDADEFIGERNMNYFDFINTKMNSDEADKHAHRIFDFYINDPQAKESFIDYLSIAMGDWLQPKFALGILDEFTAEIDDEFPFYAEIYDINEDTRIFHINRIHRRYPERIDVVYNQTRDYYDLGKVVKLNIDRGDYPVSFNERPLSQPVFDGKWYQNREIRLSSDDWRKWLINVKYEDDTKEGKEETAINFSFTPKKNVKEILIDVQEAASIDQTIIPDGNLSWNLDGNCLTVYGSDYDVYSLSGIKVASGLPNAAIELSSGVYILSAQGEKVKILIP